MARIEMDGNWKKGANIFTFFLYVFKRLLETDSGCFVVPLR